jgi:hypothetical protein
MLFRLPEKAAWFKDYNHTYYGKEKDLGEVTDKVHAEAEEETNDKTSHNASHHALHTSHNESHETVEEQGMAHRRGDGEDRGHDASGEGSQSASGRKSDLIDAVGIDALEGSNFIVQFNRAHGFAHFGTHEKPVEAEHDAQAKEDGHHPLHGQVHLTDTHRTFEGRVQSSFLAAEA